MAGLLGQAGFALTSEVEAADVIVINTCAFIGPARDEAWEKLEEAATLRRHGPCRALVVAGCLAQGFTGEIRRRVPEVDRLVGTGEVGGIVRAVQAALGQEEEGGGAAAARPAPEGFAPPAASPGYVPDADAPRLVGTPAHYAYLKIAEGCDHRCAYCLIPSLRGPYRSRPPGDLVREAQALERLGVRELVLVAQDTTVYGLDLARGAAAGGAATPRAAATAAREPGAPRLAGLVRRLLAETGIAWLRVLYGYPSTLPEDFLALMAEQSAAGRAAGDGAGGQAAGRGAGNLLPDGRVRLCRYLDLPMQHASDRILRAMRRPETGEFLLGLVQRLRRDIPSAVLRSTFIVGFPGETERDFDELLSFLETARLENAGFFAYSREEGTPAAALPGQVPEEVKAERLARAAALQREIALDFRQSLVGARLRVLVDEVSMPRENLGEVRLPGRTQDARDARLVLARGEADAPEIDGRVVFVCPSAKTPAPGDFVDVDVIDAGPYDIDAVPAR